MIGSTGLASGDFDLIRSIVRAGSGIVLEDGKGYLVQSRLDALVRKLGIPSIDELLAELRKPGARRDIQGHVVEAMTTNETSFFRDLHPFEALRTVVIPDLIARRAKEKALRIWCGAASSGQEPFTIALVLREHFAKALAGWDVKFIATDLSNEVLEQARSGTYSQLEINRGLPAALLVKYFSRRGNDWVLHDEVRKMVDFRILNLVERWPPMPAPDLVMMRNVLIYFDVPMKQQILGNIRRLMRPDGYLFLGGAETTLNIDSHFDRQEVGKTVCYRNAGQAPPKPALTDTPMPRK